MNQDQTLLWHVVHARPRCEKRVAAFCEREGIVFDLPLYRSVRKYRGKKVIFHKPLFPGYVFLRMPEHLRNKVRQCQHTARLLEVPDQGEFDRQLQDIQAALASEFEVRLAPQVHAGMKVRIKSGALRGLEGWVETRTGPVEVHLRLDFIGQAAAVRVDADILEPA